MKYYSKKQWTHKLTVMVLLAMALGGTAVQAMPSGGDIRSGQGSISQDGKNMTVLQNSDRMAIDWTKFDIAKDETVRYAQPDRNAISLNRVTGGQQSFIAGNLNANGNVVLVNPNGVVFTKNSSVDVGGLVASTARLNDEAMKNFGNGKDSLGLSLDKDSTAAVINEGQIKAQGGLVALHAANVENKGTIINEGGTLAMAAAKNLTLSAADDDKLNFTVDGDLAKAQALNSGSLKADGGYVVMTAKSAGDVLSTVVNNSGTIEAKTLRKNEKGQILLDGGDNGQVEVSGTLNASGTEAGQDAGNIKVIGQKTVVHDNTNLLAKGDNNGGKIETSGDVLNLGDNLNIDAKGVNGKAGEWLLDPLDVIIADKNNDPTGTDSYSNAEKKTAGDSDFTNGSASIDYNDPEATTANAASVNSAVTWIYTETVENMLNNGTNVTIQAAATNGSANIIVKNDIDKTAGGDATFTLDAMRNITVDGNITSKVGKLKVVLNADSDGDKIGAVIINKDIKTNGGDFISASGGTVKYTSDKNNTKGYGKGTLTGSADPVGHSVGTYFGHVDGSGTADGEKDDRLIQTNGGKITLNGEVAIGLNGGTLTLDSSNASGIPSDITVTGIINSGNSYGAYVYGTTTWDELTAEKVNEYLTTDSVPAYHYQGVNYVKNSDGTYAKNEDGSYKTTTDKADFSKGEPHYTFDKETNTQNIRWLGDGSSTAVSLDKGQGYSSVIITEGKMSTNKYLQYVAVSDPTGFLRRYMTSNPTFKVGSTSYTLTVGSVKVNGVDNNALGYNVGGKFTALTKSQIQNLADSALTLAKNSMDKTTMGNGKTAYTNLTNDIKQLIASNWFVSETLAKYNPKTKTYNEGKSAVGDSYLATITTVLENSLTTPNGQQYLWVGGRGSGVLNKKGSTNNDKLYPYSYWGMPDDPTYQDGMYWVTGPEGEANNGKGTQFYSNIGSDWGTVSLSSDGKTYTYNQGSNVYGFVNWDTWPDKATATDGKRVDVTRSQPDNSSPFLSVGYGTHGKWDDGAMGGATTVGFVKETNLANSSLNIKAGSGDVKLQGDIGKAKALDTVNIESKGAVTVGTDNNNVTDYYHGTIYADHGIYISGGTVNVGGEIHSGGTNVEATKMTDSAFSDYLDNVTIRSSGNLTVHGIEVNTSTDSDGKTTSRTDGEGGKIKLTSTGTEGVITLGDGVDYNGKSTNGGVLKAASTANDSVVIDAQGAESKFKNETSSTKAIDTKGKWKIYSASPEQNTFGKNLNSVTDDSVTDAQWTSNSTKFTAADSDENKYIFQTTPTITLYVEDHEKTYGDDITKELQSYLKSREEFTGLDGKLHNVNEFTDAFTEKTYDNYISGAEKVTVTSVGKDGADGAVGTATRTGGTHAATEKSGADGKNAVYDLNVNLNGATAKKGYVLKNENATLEILKRKASITGKGTQTYGDTDGTIKKWQQDTQTNIANGSKVTYDTSVKPGSAYTDNQKGRNTADSGTYENSVSFDNLKITDAKENEVNIADNYDLTTTGTIDVAKAKLTVNTDGKTTTYGTVDEDYKSSLDKTTQALNGDKEADLLKELGLTYTLDPKDSAYIDSDGDGKYDRTNHVKYTSDGKDYDSYTLDVANTNTLKNYEVTVNDSTVTLERAKATVDTDKVTTDYGKVDTSYTSHFKDALNGDKEEDLLKQLNLSYSTDAYKDADHTNNVKDGGYDLKVQAKGSLNYNDYDVTVNDSNVTLNKVNLTVNPEDIHRIYGQAKEVQEDAKTAYNLSGFANGDTKDTVDKDGKTIDQLVKVTNDVSKALKDDGTHTQNASAAGYDMETTASGDLTNYNIVVGEQKKVYLDKAKLTVSVNDTSTTYGQNQWTPYTYTLAGNTNGDTVDTVKNNQISVTYTNGGEKSDASNKDVKTQDVGSYDLRGEFTLSGDTAVNYEIDTDNSKFTGTAEVKKADLTLSLKNVSTTYGQGFDENTYGYKKDKSDLQGLTNGDDAKAITDVLRDSDFTYVNSGAKSDPNNENVKTQNADSYQITGSTSKTLDNYNIKVVKPGTSTVGKATLTVNPEDIKRIYGQAKEVQEDAKTAYNLSGFANGDTKDTVDKDGKTIDQLVKVTNDVSKALKDKDHTRNASAAGYDMETDASGDLTNYNIVVGDSKKVYLDKAELVIDTDSNSKVYGDWQGVKNDVEGAAHIRDAGTAVVNGDKISDLEKEMGLKTSSDALIQNPDGTYKTNHVKDGGYAIDTKFADTITNYTVKRGVVGTETLTKAQAMVNTDNVTTTYGTVDKNYTSHFNTAVNGDDANELLKQLNLSYSTEAYDKNGKLTNDVKKGGYDLFVTANGTLTHDDYNVTVKNANVTLNKAKLVIDTDSNTKVYGDWKGVKNDVEGAAHIRDEATSVVNGDKVADLMKEMGLTTSSEALIKNADGTYKTNHVKDGGYAIDTTFADTIKNYDVSRGIDGVETLTKAKAVVDTDKVTTTYGRVDKNYTSHFKNALNGDDAEQLLKNLSLTYKTDAYTDDTHTNNVKEGGYNLDVAKTADLGDYEVTVNPSNVILEKGTLVIDTTGGTKDYGNVAGVQADLDKAASFHMKGSGKQTVNGDNEDEIKNALNISVKSDVLLDNGTRTNNVNDGGYEIKANYTPELQNYKVETGTVGKEQLNRVDLYVDSNDLTKSYGDAQGVLDGLDSKERTALDGLVNGDDKQEDAIRNAIGIKNSSPAVYTKDGKSYTKDVGDYEIKTALTNQTITNYNVKTRNAGKVTLTPKSITVKNTMTQQYGSSEKKFSEATVPADQLANGDTISTKDLKFDIVSGGKYEQSLKANQAEHADAVSVDVGNYKGELIHTGGGITHADGTDAYKNYKVTVDGDIVVTPADLTVKINDANTQYGTPFDEESGKKSYDYTVVSGNTNGDTKAEVKNLLGQLKNYKNAGVGDNGRATKDVGSYGITGEQAKKLSNYTVHVEKGTATITPAPLTIKTDHVYTDYGTDYDVTVGKTVSSVEGLTNGDQDKASDISYDYGNYGGGYIEGNTKTNHVGDYDFKTTVGNKSGDFLKNYEITGGDATLTITPKDVYFHVDGKGSTFDDIIYTVTDPNHPGSRDAINSQLPYGETVTGGYGLGQALPGTPGSKDHYYTVDSTINGTPVYDNNGQGTQVGNYVYHPTGQAVIHFDPPQKPDQTTYYVEGARRPQDKIESALPVFRVDASGVVKQYGTYGIESKDQAVTLSPTGMRMPEPNQPSTQDRKYLTTLKTAHGHGTFRLEYNGVVLRVIPVDPAAEQIVTDGDKMKNVALSEQALHVAYTQMGLDLVNLKGVYIYMAPMSV